MINKKVRERKEKKRIRDHKIERPSQEDL